MEPMTLEEIVGHWREIALICSDDILITWNLSKRIHVYWKHEAHFVHKFSFILDSISTAISEVTQIASEKYAKAVMARPSRMGFEENRG